MLDLFDDKVVLGGLRPRPGLPERHGHRRAGPDEERRRGQDRQVPGGGRRTRSSAASPPRAPRTAAAPPWRTACSAKNPNINVVYTINEPAADGAFEALKAAGKEQDVLIVSVDGGCAGVKNVKDGVIGATAQQYPVKMAELGVQGHRDLAKTGQAAELSGARLLQHRRRARDGQAGRRRREHHHRRRPDICWGK